MTVTLVWHDLTPRELTVRRISRLTPRMIRVTLGGPELAGFHYGAPDDHVKLFFPEPGTDRPVMPTLGPDGLEPPPPGAPRPTFRDYTVRYLRPDEHELDIDFAVHGDGPGTTWAAGAKPGDRLGVLGPRGSYVNSFSFDWYLLAGDETALPAVGAWLEWLPEGARAFVFLEVADPAERQPLTTKANAIVAWLFRSAGSTLERAVTGMALPPGDGYVFVAGEAGGLKGIRRHFRALGLPKDHAVIDGYWKRGVVNLDHHEDDDD